MIPQRCRTFALMWFISAAVVLPSGAANATEGMAKRGNAKFFRSHAEFLERGAKGPVGVLFLGDSITAGWKSVPKLWEAGYSKYQPANFGIGGDRTEHVIWRIEQGELDKISPKVVVVMIGTNNTGDNAAVEIAAGNRKIVALIQEALPETKILLLGVFPRGPRTNGNGQADPWEQKMAKINAINTDLAQLDDGDRVRFLDIGDSFRGADGALPKDIMPDQLHLNAAGYQIWIDAMAPLLTDMME